MMCRLFMPVEKVFIEGMLPHKYYIAEPEVQERYKTALRILGIYQRPQALPLILSITDIISHFYFWNIG